LSAEITTASRDASLNGVSVREGQYIGLLEGEMVAAGDDVRAVLRDVLVKAEADKRELVTLYYGNNTHRGQAQALVDDLAGDFPDQAFEVIYGGQALYSYFIGIE